MTAESQKVFPFIVGAGRSGTTLLRVMLEANSLIAIPGESHFLPQLLASRARYERASSVDLERLVEDLFQLSRFRLWDLERDRVARDLALMAPTDIPAALRCIYKTYAVSRGKVRYGDKTPAHASSISILARAFPEARFIHLIRDGRNVVLSQLEARHAGFHFVGVADAAIDWRRTVSRARDVGRLMPNRYLEVRYESLVTDTEATLKEVCRFADLPFEEEMLRYFERTRTERLGLRTIDIHKNLQKEPIKEVRDWRSVMSERDKAVFDLVAGRLLRDLGYALGSATSSRRIKVESLRSVARGYLRLAVAKIRFWVGRGIKLVRR